MSTQCASLDLVVSLLYVFLTSSSSRFLNHDYGDFSILIIITSDHVSSLTICILCIVL
jgi:hypothetical protein